MVISLGGAFWLTNMPVFQNALSRARLLSQSNRYDPFVAAGVHVITVQGEVRQAVLLPVDVNGGLCEWHRLAGDNACDHVPGLRDVGEDPCPAGSFRIEREYHSPPPAETNPYLTASSQRRPSGNSPNETYQSRPFHGSFALDVLPPVGSGARS
jgi:hypothetical protein